MFLFRISGRLLVAGLLIGVYVVALSMPAVNVGGGPELSGFTLLRRGWEAGEYGIYSWYANPLMLIAIAALAVGFPRLTVVVAGLSLMLALTSFSAGDLARAGGLAVSGLTFRAGFAVWLAVPTLAAAYGCAALFFSRRSRGNSKH